MLYKFLKAVAKIFLKIFFKINLVGSFPNTDENYIICANHSSFLDPIILAICHDSPINFMGKKELFKNPLLAKFFRSVFVFEVDRNANDLKALKESVRRLKDGKTVGIFIEGTRVENYKPGNAKPGPILIGNMAKKKIIPVKIETDYKIFSQINVIVRQPFIIDKKYLKENRDTGYKELAEQVLYKIYEGDKN